MDAPQNWCEMEMRVITIIKNFEEKCWFEKFPFRFRWLSKSRRYMGALKPCDWIIQWPISKNETIQLDQTFTYRRAESHAVCRSIVSWTWSYWVDREQAWRVNITQGTPGVRAKRHGEQRRKILSFVNGGIWVGGRGEKVPGVFFWGLFLEVFFLGPGNDSVLITCFFGRVNPQTNLKNSWRSVEFSDGVGCVHGYCINMDQRTLRNVSTYIPGMSQLRASLNEEG